MMSKIFSSHMCGEHKYIFLVPHRNTEIIMALAADPLPTFYEYYSGNGVREGLSEYQPYFTLNQKNITIYSGAFHYFRVPRNYWRDRLRKMRAAGLNTVETYVPWNLHEPQSGVYDFGDGGSDMEHLLHVEEFLKTAQEEDLFALVRPGPYICAEWEFGGLPSWILRNTTSVRNSNDSNFLSYVKRYFNILLPILAALQFQYGGPIIGLQIENEYGGTGVNDQNYLQALRQIYLDNGIVELLYTSDSPSDNGRGLYRSNKPTMTMEYWTGWFDHWTEDHHTVTSRSFSDTLEAILNYPSSVNMYTFIGSTNFGFLNGANTQFSGLNNSGYQPTTSSYDYDAPITESGNYTDKYNIVKQTIEARATIKFQTPSPPEVSITAAYPTLKLENQLYLKTLIDNSDLKFSRTNLVPMELLPINNNSGQSYGYIVYRKTNLYIPANAVLKISGYVRDTVLVLINGVLVSGSPKVQNAVLELVVENFGRNNYGSLSQFLQFKGLTDPVFINEEPIIEWEIIPLEFKRSQNVNFQGWETNIQTRTETPALYKSSLNISYPQDTYIDMREWTKGIVIVNGFIVGRYFFLGPQQSLYIPAPFLVKGNNDIIIFEHYTAPDSIKFSETPIFGGASH
ncbi:hypothetical protein NQ314_003898 [Rhamnusium bicolor]|uniref:Beta-galactosidase n=1 Tax=Rhamnusium bicolor TaxID=1586634 RepID=A0AAV8ZL54_9CUCU|nr:hypothetical protein NQ314_003898 [Rhamnusium bicolor]